MGSGSGHVLVPKHSVSSEDEVKKLVGTLGKPVEKLPFIKADDPAIAALEARPGDVIRIERASPVTKKTEIYYRLVVDAE